MTGQGGISMTRVLAALLTVVFAVLVGACGGGGDKGEGLRTQWEVSETTLPASTLFCMPGAPDDSTPTILMRGFTDLSAIATPEMSPPPPIGTTTTSASGKSS